MNDGLRGDGLPDLLPNRTMLYLTSPESQTLQRLRRVLLEADLQTDAPYPGVLAVDCRREQLQQISDVCANTFDPFELEQMRSRLTDTDASPSISELMQSQTLTNLIAWINGQWLHGLLTSQRLVTYFQPIVLTGDPAQVFAYECLLRANETDGRLISPDRLYSAARATRLLEWLDQAARVSAIESASQRQLNTCVFINFNPRSITDPVRSLKSTIRATLASGIDPARFVFEVVESERIDDPDQLLEILDYYREVGCRVALDDLGAGYSSLNLMTRVKPDFIKLDMELVRNVDQDTYKSCVAAKLLELAKELGVQTVVEGVETEGEWQWAQQHGADFAQGYLFARPQAIPPRSVFVGNTETPVLPSADQVSG